MTSRRPTQKQIAERLGLSPATVSLALRDSPMIAAKTRKLVREKMEEAGYVHNAAAASLRTGRSGIVGISLHSVDQPFFAELLTGLERRLRAAGTAVLLNTHEEDPAALERFIDQLSAYGGDALVLSPPPAATAEMLAPMRRRHMPVVYVARHIDGDDEADRIVNADGSATQRAAARLIELGHRRLVLVGGKRGTSMAAGRVAGFRAAIEAAGLDWSDDLWLAGASGLTGGAEATDRVLDRPDPPTGFVCFSDAVAIGVMNALRKRGLEPGRDAGVVGVGLGRPEEAASVHPALTTVLDNPAKLGEIAAETLLARLSEPDAPARHLSLAPKLVVRQSCGGPIS